MGPFAVALVGTVHQAKRGYRAFAVDGIGQHQYIHAIDLVVAFDTKEIATLGFPLHPGTDRPLARQFSLNRGDSHRLGGNRGQILRPIQRALQGSCNIAWCRLGTTVTAR